MRFIELMIQPIACERTGVLWFSFRVSFSDSLHVRINFFTATRSHSQGHKRYSKNIIRTQIVTNANS